MSRYTVSLAGIIGMLTMPQQVLAADSYRWLTVTIDTPWAIFIFLLPMVLTPIILMAILYWRFAMRPVDKSKTEKKEREIVDKQSP